MVKKISIIGAGAVGSSAAFSILNRIPPKELALVDICEGLAKGVALDLEDTRGILHFSTKISGSEDYSLVKNSDIVIFTAGVARKKGMTRLDLLKINGAIAKDVAKKIKKFAPKAIVIAVTNPLDIITYIMLKETGFNRNRVIGMGSSLDTSRLFNIIHGLAGVSTKSLEGFIFGSHSKDMIVSLHRIMVDGQALRNTIKKESQAKIKERVQLRGAEIVSHLKTKSACFAPGLAICSLIEAIVNDTNQVMPVSILLKGEYGLRDTCLGVPCLVNKKGADKIIQIKLTAGEKKELQKAEQLFKECMI